MEKALLHLKGGLPAHIAQGTILTAGVSSLGKPFVSR